MGGSGSVPGGDGDAFVRGLVRSIADRRGEMPPAVEIVQERLIRRVGRVRGPDGAWIYLKSMHFPRFKDRLRYLFRALPGRHEAAMLEILADRLGERVPGPRPLALETRRTMGFPSVSVLALSGLPVVDRPTVEAVAPGEVVPGVDIGAAASVASALAAAGIEHRDLHPGNLVRLTDGRVGVLDLQSCSASASALGRTARRRIAVKLLQGRFAGADPSVLSAAGLVDRDDLEVVVERAEAARRKNLRRRLLRCFRNSTEFRRTSGLWRRHHFRRDAAEPFERLRVDGVSVRRLWLADRAREVLDHEPPVFAGASFCLGPGRQRDWLYIAKAATISASDEVLASLDAAYDRCFQVDGRLRPASELRAAGIDLSRIE